MAQIERLQGELPSIASRRSPTQLTNGNPDLWKQRYSRAVERGIELVNGGELHKLVLAVRHTIDLDDRFNPLPLLQRLRRQQAGSCRFLWQRKADDLFFGASPERLLSLRGAGCAAMPLPAPRGRG